MILDLLTGKKREPAECVIKVGNSLTEIVDLYPLLAEVSIETSREQAAEATLKFETRRDEHGAWTVQDSGLFAPWEPMRIEAAFGSTVEEIFRGYIREIQADYPSESGATNVTIKAQDESLKLDREHVRREWGGDNPVTDASIAQEIVEFKHGLALHPDSKPGLSGLVLLQDSTDIRFLRQRAEANGYELIFREGEVYFGTMRLDAEPQSAILVYAGPDTNCIHLSIQDDGHKPDQVVFDLADTEGAGVTQRSINPDLPLLGNEPAESTASGLGDFSWRMSRQGGRNEDELTAMAQKKANEQSMKIKATGDLDGSLYGHVLRVGEPVGVDGLGDRYGGIYYVDTVHHTFDFQGYRQSFTLLRNAYGDNLSSVTSKLAGLV